MSDKKVLTKEIAEQFLADEDSVRLSKFTAIEDAAAESLSKYEGTYLYLNNLTELSDAAAKSLSKHEGYLSLSGLTSLSDGPGHIALASALVSSQEDTPRPRGVSYVDSLYLDNLTELSDAAAKSLSKHEGYLSLSGLTSLSDAAAENLSKHEGLVDHFSLERQIEDLRLDGLTSLSDAASESLSKHKGGLSLNGLTSLSDATAESLSKHEGDLSLDGLTSLSDAAAESLSKHEGVYQHGVLKKLSLHGLTSLSDAAAGSLGATRLSANAEVERQIKKAVLTKRQQARKAARTGETALTKQQTANIRKLLKSKDAINIKLAIELLQSTDATADDWSQSFSSTVLSQLVNTLDCDVWNAIAAGLQSFSGLLTEFMGLAAERYLRLSGARQESFIEFILSNCEPPLSSVIDAILSKHNGDSLSFDGLTSLSDVAAESLSKHEGDLSLYGLTSLADAAAEILSKHKGDLHLGGLTSLSDAAAESLSKHTGKINLAGLTILSDAAAERLSKHKGEISLYSLTELSDAAAKHLAKRTYLSVQADKLPASAAKILRDAMGSETLWQVRRSGT